MRAALASGEHGASLTLPDSFVVHRDDADCLHVHDPASNLGWFVFFFPMMSFDLAQREALVAQLEPQARFMFDSLFASQDQDQGVGPRTDDPTWSTMIEHEFLRVGGAPVLRTIHRMAYQAGSEVVMGHLLVPLAGGLLEIRVIGAEQLTGVRETALVLALGAEDPTSLRQADFDDPRHDAAFPAHALSRVRAALAGLDVQVSAPAAPLPVGEVDLAELGCAIVPAPRFSLSSQSVRSARFDRSSFCGSDGLEALVVACVEAEVGRPSLRRLAGRANRAVWQMHQGEGVTDLRVDVVDLPAGALLAVEGQGPLGRLRNLFRWFLDDAGRPWYVATLGLAAGPPEARLAELDAVVSSFRLTRAAPPAARKPWWRFGR